MPVEAHAYPRPLPNPAWLGKLKEEILEPELPIVDPHHHLWDHPGSRYLLDELLADVNSGHNIVATVFIQCGSGYRTSGPEEMRAVGESEFVRAIAEDADRRGTKTKICAGIVSFADLRLSNVDEVLEAQITAAGGRFRGIRQIAAHDPAIIGASSYVPPPGLMDDPNFRRGLKRLPAHDSIELPLRQRLRAPARARHSGRSVIAEARRLAHPPSLAVAWHRAPYCFRSSETTRSSEFAFRLPDRHAPRRASLPGSDARSRCRLWPSSSTSSGSPDRQSRIRCSVRKCCAQGSRSGRRRRRSSAQRKHPARGRPRPAGPVASRPHRRAAMRARARGALAPDRLPPRCGHSGCKTVFIQCGSGYRTSGPEEMRAVGESEFVRAIAEDADRRGTKTKICAGIVSFADLRLSNVDEVLEAQITAAGGRFRGILVAIGTFDKVDRACSVR